ncbi:MAG: S41 family peptidase, partial [Acidithiobacillus sp.]
APTAATQSTKEDEAMAASSVLKPDLAKDYPLHEALAILEGKAVPVQEKGHTVDTVIPLPKAAGQ